MGSMAARVYLDWNATAPLRPQARALMAAAMDVVGNPSSVHSEGRAARRLVEEARERVAALVGARPNNVVFTSGGSEANVLALSPALQRDGERAPRDRLLVSAIEHPSVCAGGRFPAGSVEEVPVTGHGIVDLGALERRLVALGQQGSRPLVSVMHANNETGIIQPIATAAELTHQVGGLLHVDAVQSAGKIPCDINVLGADSMTLSAHKMGGPKGAGALVLADGVHFTDPLLKGGGQERGNRAGTENVIGIVGFGAAAEAAGGSLDHDARQMAALRDCMEARLRQIAPDTVIFGTGERLPNTTLFAVAGLKAETALIALDLAGIAVSSGSACSSGKVAPSHVLAAMAVSPALAAGAIRVSLGATTTESDIEFFLKTWTARIIGLSKDKCGLAA